MTDARLLPQSRATCDTQVPASSCWRCCNPPMQASNYFVAQAESHPCWQCHHYGGPLPDNDINCFCRHPCLSPVVGQPENGCAFWERASSTDDERRQP